MKLYGHPASGCTRRVLAVLAERGVEAEFVLADLVRAEQKRSEHLALHPFGKVPVLDEDGFVLYEAHAIMRYLDATLPGPRLVPEDVRARALMDQHLSAYPSYFGPHMQVLMNNLVLAPLFGRAPDDAAVERARQEIAAALGPLEVALLDREYLAGTFSLADITFMPFLQGFADSKQDDLLTSHVGIAAWWNRLRSRASWQRVKAVGFRPPAAAKLES